MGLGKAFLWGLPLVVGGALIKWAGDINFSFWQPVFDYWWPNLSPVVQWLIALAMTFIVVASLGNLVRITVPLRTTKIARWLFLLIFKGNRPVVLVEWGGNDFFALLLEKNEKKWKVVILSLPLPLSGQLLFVQKEKVTLTGLTLVDLFNQMVSFGLQPVLEKLEKFSKDK
jgi:hypothetical protein